MSATKVPVVFIPGIGCTGEMFRRQIEDLRGILEPWEAPLYPADTIEEIGRLILANCPFDRFAVAGASMGGYLCFELYKQAADRILALAPISTMPQADPAGLASRRLLLNEQVRSGRWRSMCYAAARRCLAPMRRDDQATIDEVTQHITSSSQDAFLLHQDAMRKRVGYEAMLRDIECPTTVIAGIDDEVIPFDVQAAMQAEIPESQLVAVKDCGHLPNWEQPGKLSEALHTWLCHSRVVAA